MLIHGDSDAYVPTEMSRKNALVHPELTELYIVEGAKHAQAVYFETDEYLRRQVDFLRKNMTKWVEKELKMDSFVKKRVDFFARIWDNIRVDAIF